MALTVVTDSAACLPPALADARGIVVIPLHTTEDDAGTATTARPAVAELAEAYRKAAAGGNEVLALHLASALSGTVDNARIAARELAAEGVAVTTLDSGASGGALGLAAVAAAEADDARRGAARARESVARSRLFFLVQDLSYLRRGGRIDRATAFAGGTLGIRPILTTGPQGISVVEMVRGTARARRHLIAQAVRAAGGTSLTGPRPPAAPVRLAVHFCDDPAAGRALENDLADAMVEAGAVVESIMRSPADPASRVHLGPGALGIVVAPHLDQPR
ncbi:MULTISPECIES: DegV family protein [unclassified Actinomyces]|uniref:DegV family protein n=1 Tax=unclassified Actinomyces TaxID=2609248 RepID=UPI0013A6D9BD|nr:MULTISPECIES: DegV family protein [unclassified Actinomyces]MBW3070125.1 DegV family EDD domain-containing protein [Actinomyces sp. 594]NDR52533.1 DegV family EDD domain-containing protein [Actinomyces sp. 565]